MGRRAAFVVGQRVRITRPVFVIRAGYPKTVDDYLTHEVRKAVGDAATSVGLSYGHSLTWEPRGRKGAAIARAARELAYALAVQDRFGGRDRTLHHTAELTEHAGKLVHIRAKKRVVTGRYVPARGGHPEDHEPAYLENATTHVLLRVDTAPLHAFSATDMLWIEQTNVEAVKPPPSQFAERDVW